MHAHAEHTSHPPSYGHSRHWLAQVLRVQAAGAVAAAVVSGDEADVVMRAPAATSGARAAIPALLLPRSPGAALRAAVDAARAAGVLLQATLGDPAFAEQAAVHAGGSLGGRGGRGAHLKARDLGSGRGEAGEEEDGSSECLHPMSAPAQTERREAPAEGSGASIWEQRAGNEPGAHPGEADPGHAPGPETAAPGSPPAVPAAQGAAPSAEGPQGSTPPVAGIEVELLLPPQTQAWLQAALGAQAQVGEALGALLEALSGAAMQAALVARQAQHAQHKAAGAGAERMPAGCVGGESAGDGEHGCVERGSAVERLDGGSEKAQEACSAVCPE